MTNAPENLEEKAVEKQTAHIGRSSAIVHLLAFVSCVLLVVFLFQLRGPVSRDEGQPIAAAASVSGAAFVVFWLWSVVLSIRAVWADEDDYWANKVYVISFIELLAVLSIRFV